MFLIDSIGYWSKTSQTIGFVVLEKYLSQLPGGSSDDEAFPYGNIGKEIYLHYNVV